uniref:Putative UPF0481 protein At3g02645 n=1 Tax=Tanacetum cinerariifolium TaxID=118510 RepID=A0A6L2NYK7_TANCI|nr:putative UPF0481 protein At3g02645 [Tanacetum cinerariifolium]
MAHVDVELGDVPNIRDSVQILLDSLERGQSRSRKIRPSICMVPVSSENLAQVRSTLRCIRTDVTDTTHDHILGLFHRSYHFASTKTSSFSGRSTVHSAVELIRAGVNFKPNEESKRAMDIKYESSRTCLYFPWGKPTLRMPELYIDDDTELVIRNFIAYEQTSTQVDYSFTSYAHAIDMLVDTQDDVAKLVESKVVINNLGSNEEAAKLINGICKEIYLREFFYRPQWVQLDRYYMGYWPRNIARLRRTYFSSPWNTIALLAGIVLFAVTIVQTIFTIKN